MAAEKDGQRLVSELDESTQQSIREMGSQLRQAGVERLADTNEIGPPTPTPADAQPERQNERFRGRGMDDSPQRGSAMSRADSPQATADNDIQQRRESYKANVLSNHTNQPSQQTNNEHFHEIDKNLGQNREEDQNAQVQEAGKSSIFDRYSSQHSKEDAQNRQQEQEKVKDNER